VNTTTTIKQQLIAGYLLVVISFITAAKLFHVHETIGKSDLSLNTVQVYKSANCSICDYHFAEVADYHIFSIELPRADYQNNIFFIYKKNQISSTGLSYSDRGPPAQF